MTTPAQDHLIRALGRLRCGPTWYVWDYAANEAVPEHDMPRGSRRWQQSERALFAQAKANLSSRQQPADQASMRVCGR